MLLTCLTPLRKNAQISINTNFTLIRNILLTHTVKLCRQKSCHANPIIFLLIFAQFLNEIYIFLCVDCKMCVCEYVLYKSNIPTAISMQVIESLYTTGWIWNKGCLVYMYNIQTTECINVIYFWTQIIVGIFALFFVRKSGVSLYRFRNTVCCSCKFRLYIISTYTQQVYKDI